MCLAQGPCYTPSGLWCTAPGHPCSDSPVTVIPSPSGLHLQGPAVLPQGLPEHWQPCYCDAQYRRAPAPGPCCTATGPSWRQVALLLRQTAEKVFSTRALLYCFRVSLQQSCYYGAQHSRAPSQGPCFTAPGPSWTPSTCAGHLHTCSGPGHTPCCPSPWPPQLLEPCYLEAAVPVTYLPTGF